MHDVTLKPDGQLVVRSDNQPAYRLVPLHGRRFRIAEPKGYSVEFRGDATIKEVIFHQPNRTYAPQQQSTAIRSPRRRAAVIHAAVASASSAITPHRCN
jgi:hypothetical protein